MEYRCDVCTDLVEASGFSMKGEELVLFCPLCKGETRLVRNHEGRQLPAPVLELIPTPRAVPSAARCPKCAAKRVGSSTSCARCGLSYALFCSEDFALPPAVEELWKTLLSRWEDPSRHEAFLAACAGCQGLAEAARRYRFRAEETPSDPLAARFRDEACGRLLAEGMPSIEASAARPPLRAPRLLKVLALLVGFALLAFVLHALQSLGSGAGFPLAD
jgi:hypothetical protein